MTGASKKVPRKYPRPDVKLLYSRAAGKCCFPACGDDCVEEDLATGEIINSGQIAHIESVGENAVRHNPDLTIEARDSYSNWILLCGKHHPRVDADSAKAEKTYTVQTIRQWKSEAETRLVRQTQNAMPDLSSEELAIVAKHIMKNINGAAADESFTLLAVRQKIEKNKLTDYVASLLEVGIAKASEVGNFVNQMESISPGFAETLKMGFIKKYEDFHQQGYREDSLFESLRHYASQGSQDPKKSAAGLAVLAYYFELCEVFEK